MKGLLLKDTLTMFKQMKLFLVFIVVLAVLPGSNMFSFAIVYAAMLPITALAYDERSKWDSLAAMMPYSKRELVLSKYLLGYIAVLAAGILTLAMQYIVSIVRDTPVTVETLMIIFVTVCAGAVLLAIIMPLMFRFGVEKGRFIFIAIIAIAVSIGMLSNQKASSLLTLPDITPTVIIALVFAATVAMNVISILISARLYRKKTT